MKHVDIASFFLFFGLKKKGEIQPGSR